MVYTPSMQKPRGVEYKVRNITFEKRLYNLKWNFETWKLHSDLTYKFSGVSGTTEPPPWGLNTICAQNEAMCTPDKRKPQEVKNKV